MSAPIPAGIPTSNLVLMLQTQDSPALYNSVANLSDFTGPTLSTTTVDTSHHGNKFRDFVATLIDTGTIAFPTFFDPSQPTLAGNPQALTELLLSRELKTWLLAFVDDDGIIVPTTGPQMLVNAYVTKFSLKEPVAGVYTADTELRSSGKPTFLFPTTVMPAGQPL